MGVRWQRNFVGGSGWHGKNVYAACSGCVVDLSFGDMDGCQDDPQYKVMKYLVFETTLSSLLSELQVMIPKVDRSGITYVMAWRQC
jgi:hypothetical protein